MDWIPEGGKRKVGHLRRRWIDRLVTFLQISTAVEDWREAVLDREAWAEMAEKYAMEG